MPGQHGISSSEVVDRLCQIPVGDIILGVVGSFESDAASAIIRSKQSAKSG
jgi:hypothetical protein